MKKLFISVPMKGRTEENIRKSLEKMHKLAEIVFDEKLEVLKKNSNVKPKRIKLATDNEYKERWKVRW